MRTDASKEFKAKLGMPSSDAIKKGMEKQEAFAFMKKHIKEHEKFLRMTVEYLEQAPELIIQELSDLASKTINTLEANIENLDAKELNLVIEKCSSLKREWPVNISSRSKQEHETRMDLVFGVLNLGDNSMFDVEHRRATRAGGDKAAIAKDAMVKMLLNIERYRKKYKEGGGRPPFSKAGKLEALNSTNAADWFNLSIEILESVSDRKPWELDFRSSISDTLEDIVIITSKQRRGNKTAAQVKAQDQEGCRRDRFKKHCKTAFLAMIHPDIRNGISPEDDERFDSFERDEEYGS